MIDAHSNIRFIEKLLFVGFSVHPSTIVSFNNRLRFKLVYSVDIYIVSGEAPDFTRMYVAIVKTGLSVRFIIVFNDDDDSALSF